MKKSTVIEEAEKVSKVDQQREKSPPLIVQRKRTGMINFIGAQFFSFVSTINKANT